MGLKRHRSFSFFIFLKFSSSSVAGTFLGRTSAPLSTFMSKGSFYNRYCAPYCRFLYFQKFWATQDVVQVVLQVRRVDRNVQVNFPFPFYFYFVYCTDQKLPFRLHCISRRTQIYRLKTPGVTFVQKPQSFN